MQQFLIGSSTEVAVQLENNDEHWRSFPLAETLSRKHYRDGDEEAEVAVQSENNDERLGSIPLAETLSKEHYQDGDEEKL